MQQVYGLLKLQNKNCWRISGNINIFLFSGASRSMIRTGWWRGAQPLSPTDPNSRGEGGRESVGR